VTKKTSALQIRVTFDCYKRNMVMKIMYVIVMGKNAQLRTLKWKRSLVERSTEYLNERMELARAPRNGETGRCS